jgi:hypothetical protein
MYAGYINVDKTNNRNLYYWFVESQGSPATDPVILWLNGGGYYLVAFVGFENCCNGPLPARRFHCGRAPYNRAITKRTRLQYCLLPMRGECRSRLLQPGWRPVQRAGPVVPQCPWHPGPQPLRVEHRG